MKIKREETQKGESLLWKMKVQKMKSHSRRGVGSKRVQKWTNEQNRTNTKTQIVNYTDKNITDLTEEHKDTEENITQMETADIQDNAPATEDGHSLKQKQRRPKKLSKSPLMAASKQVKLN